MVGKDQGEIGEVKEIYRDINAVVVHKKNLVCFLIFSRCQLYKLNFMPVLLVSFHTFLIQFYKTSGTGNNKVTNVSEIPFDAAAGEVKLVDPSTWYSLLIYY